MVCNGQSLLCSFATCFDITWGNVGMCYIYCVDLQCGCSVGIGCVKFTVNLSIYSDTLLGVVLVCVV